MDEEDGMDVEETSERENGPLSNLQTEDVDDFTVTENGVFYFESDHLALKGNKDYQNLIRTLAILEGQRNQAIKDLEKIIECQENALQDPIKFVQNLQNGLDMGLPKATPVVNIPKIPWENYTSNIPTTFGATKTRGKKLNLESLIHQPTTSTASEVQPSSVVVRGRVKTDDKVETFNRLWTYEEQKKLEALLITNPPEENEANRFQKIANALGTRTKAQVASRVQKYFIKLAKARLPVPGRKPNMGAYRLKGTKYHKHQRFNRYLRPTTLTTLYDTPVTMGDDDDDDDDAFSYSSGHTENDNSMMQEFDYFSEDDESVPLEQRHTSEYLEIIHLRKLKRDKIRDEDLRKIVHTGYRCDRCELDPITGIRWHCRDCPEDGAIDLCQDCQESGFETAIHNSSHRLDPNKKVEKSETLVDADYAFGESDNYLDPNYMPAT